VQHGNELPGTIGLWWQARFLRGADLFNAGYYWEAHEVWEELWHIEGRRGPTADVLKGLIKLAAAGVKVREGRENGVRSHCRRAAELFARAAAEGEGDRLGLDMDLWAARSHDLAENPPRDPGPKGAAVSRVFAFQIEPALWADGGQ
jgi:predicted metal-dependent hydrolase